MAAISFACPFWSSLGEIVMSEENTVDDAVPLHAANEPRRAARPRRSRQADWGVTDAELIDQLRGGDTEAYAELWRRNYRAAHRFAYRVSAEHADDLTSQAFLVVYQQITVKGGGPRSSFLSYLFAVIRNESISLHRSAGALITDDEVDRVDERDALAELEDRAQSKSLIEALHELPERWQQVLWLCGIADENRTAVAAQMGLSLNGVAALYRRARAGLRQQYLLGQVPSVLRDDSGHVARLLPAHFARRGSARFATPVTEHLESCSACRSVEAELSCTSGRVRGRTSPTAPLAA